MTAISLPGVVIRLATLEDLEVLIKLRLDFLAESFRSLGDEEIKAVSTQLREYYGRNLSKDLFAVLACLEGEIISCAFLVIDERPANLSFPTGRIGTVLNVYTIPVWRGKGLATQILDEILNIARVQQVSRLQLKASATAISLYEKVGFQIEDNDFTNMVMSMLKKKTDA